MNNAAVVATERRTTVDWIEETLAVGHLAPFLLTELLLPTLLESTPARVVNVTSGVVRKAELALDDVQSARAYRLSPPIGARSFSTSRGRSTLRGASKGRT